MAYALVGTIGAVASGVSSVTPGWGVGENRTANNLLICWAYSTNLTNLSVPSGWNAAINFPPGEYTGIFWRIATGSDAAPAVAGGTSVIAQLAEFSGGNTSAPVDKNAFTGAVTTTPGVATASGPDIAPGELLVYVSGAFYTTAATKTLTPTLTTATAVDTNNNTVLSVDHYDWGYGITTANAVADKFSLALTTTKISQGQVSLASFKLASLAALLSTQAHHRFPGATQNRRNTAVSQGRF